MIITVGLVLLGCFYAQAAIQTAPGTLSAGTVTGAIDGTVSSFEVADLMSSDQVVSQFLWGADGYWSLTANLNGLDAEVTHAGYNGSCPASTTTMCLCHPDHFGESNRGPLCVPTGNDTIQWKVFNDTAHQYMQGVALRLRAPACIKQPDIAFDSTLIIACNQGLDTDENESITDERPDLSTLCGVNTIVGQQPIGGVCYPCFVHYAAEACRGAQCPGCLHGNCVLGQCQCDSDEWWGESCNIRGTCHNTTECPNSAVTLETCQNNSTDSSIKVMTCACENGYKLGDDGVCEENTLGKIIKKIKDASWWVVLIVVVAIVVVIATAIFVVKRYLVCHKLSPEERAVKAAEGDAVKFELRKLDP